MRDLREGDLIPDTTMTVTLVIDECASGLGTVIYEATDGRSIFDVIEGQAVRVGIDPAARRARELRNARRITLVCLITLALLGLWSAASGTWQGFLVAIVSFTFAGVCRYWLRTRLAPRSTR